MASWPDPRELHWTALAAILQQTCRRRRHGSTAAAISRWLTFDLENPDSIMELHRPPRANARGIRGSINSEMWKELNKLYWQLCDPAFSGQAKELAAPSSTRPSSAAVISSRAFSTLP